MDFQEYVSETVTEPMQATVSHDGLEFYPLTSPGMPLPGPDFIRAAVSLGDAEPVYYGKRQCDKVLQDHGIWLAQLYKAALYNGDFLINVEVKGRHLPAKFIPGHIWGGGTYGPRQQCDVLLLGKWPGMEELQYGRNMVGPSGSVLMQALDECHIPREVYMSWYITNLIKHPQLDPSTSKAPVSQVKNCLPLLEQELRILRPKYILVMGADAVEHFFPEKINLTTVQGRVLSRPIFLDNGVIHEPKVMCAIHPAAVAHTPDRYNEFKNAIYRFTELVAGRASTEVMDDVDHRLVYTERDLAKIVDDTLAEPDNASIAIDGEWHGDYPTEPGAWLRSIQFSHKPGFACAVVLRHRGGRVAFMPGIEAAVRQLKRLLVSTPGRPVRIIGHNLRADLPWLELGLDAELGKALKLQFDAPADPDRMDLEKLGGPAMCEATRTEGGFDTMLAGHSINETGDFKLEVMGLNYCNIQRYDTPLLQWKQRYCHEHDIKENQLEGYGECPDEIMLGTPWDYPGPPVYGIRVKDSYACWDADTTQRLFRKLNDELLDLDVYGQSGRRSFWISQIASKGFLEMEMVGVKVNQRRAEQLSYDFGVAQERQISEIRKLLNWGKFNPASNQQCVVALFGPAYSSKIDKETGDRIDIRPEGAISLNLPPVKTAGKPSQNWDKVVQKRQQDLFNPSTDKEVLGILCLRLFNEPGYEEVKLLRNIRFCSQVLKLLKPLRDKDGVIVTTKTQHLSEDSDIVMKRSIVVDGGDADEDDEGDWIFAQGIMSFVHADARVRTHFFQTKETGRASSARPPVQNLSKRREKDYKKILGDGYRYPIRSIIEATPGWVLVEADYRGAELLMMAIQSGDKVMIEHCLLANLPDGDPRQYDIHSSMAVGAFNLTVPDAKEKKTGEWIPDLLRLKVGDPLPKTKYAIEITENDNLRTAAKTLMFGIPYGRGDEAVIRAVEEEGVRIDLQQARQLRDTIFYTYPLLDPYFEGCRARVRVPGYMVDCLGGRRRFPKVIDAKDGGAMEREAGNFPIQSGVARAISIAMHHLYNWPGREDFFRMCLQIHDALLFEVQPHRLAEFYEVVRECMTNRIDIWQCNFDGKRVGDQSYHMETDIQIMLNWGVKLDREKGLAAGIPDEFLPKKKAA